MISEHPDMEAHEEALRRAAQEATEIYLPMSTAVHEVRRQALKHQAHGDELEGFSRVLGVLRGLLEGVAPGVYYQTEWKVCAQFLARYPELEAVHAFFSEQACR